ncbi:MbtH family NRPS accessory protein [Streptomyces sp. NBC_00893]|uniref:MbtH family protein n=1 Tax=Streptomyces sp. NBC_00893 TaxID=2975862 RepID=UPI00225B1D93|nr:MbtH family NRPS accessory protein [Streptomyces sp. NBC_00893]MCX4845680.1 MbtH family NRPS accessory protein [Streptomyces sp. NBC_00893]
MEGIRVPGDSRAVLYQVVVNDAEQYSIWPAGTPAPAGWRAEGPARTEEECLAHIEEVWTDMRPLGLRGRTKR